MNADGQVFIDDGQPLIVVRAKKLGPQRRDTEQADTRLTYLVELRRIYSRGNPHTNHRRYPNFVASLV